MPHNSETITVTKTDKVTTVTEGSTDTVEASIPGKPGPVNVLTMGSVTTGSSDSASATITGTAPSQVLNLVLPKAAVYTHTQGSAATSWTIAHNLGYYPNVSIVDSSGNVVIGDVQHSSNNQVVVSFSGAFSGSAYLS